MAHPRNVGWGEIGLDYHYDNSPRDVQQDVFTRQLRHAVRLGKPITVHTREADEDTERILKAEVPVEHKVRPAVISPLSKSSDATSSAPHRSMSIASRMHPISRSACWTTSRTCTLASLVRTIPPPRATLGSVSAPALTIRGAPGVITFSSNENTSNIVRRMFAQSPAAPRIVLETDAPYMVPANIYGSLPAVKGRLPLCHTAMIPWTAEFVAEIAGKEWDVERVLELGRANAHRVYGV